MPGVVDVRGGPGRDRIAIEVGTPDGGRTGVWGDATVCADGGEDPDIVAMTLTNVDLLAESRLRVELGGGAGDDAVGFRATGGAYLGQLGVSMDGHAGDDRIVGRLDATDLSAGTARPSFSLAGRAGNDVLEFVTGSIAEVECDGGDGDDTLSVRADLDGNRVAGPAQGPVSPVLRFEAALRGGVGIDRITSRMGVQPTPFMPSLEIDLTADGGADRDIISAEALVLPGAAEGFNPQPEPPSARFDMTIAGGIGDDDISARMGVQPTPFLPVVDLNLDVDGGAGDDALSAISFVGPGTAEGFNPQPEPPAARFDVALRGGSGVDRITSRMGVQPTPFLPVVVGCSLVMDGGAGNDVLDAWFDADAAGQKVAGLRVALLGGDGDDSLRLGWTEGAFDALAFADGGAGVDVGVFGPGVRSVNVERLG